MSKIDEGKLNTALKTIADYFQSVSELSLKCHKQIADMFTSGTVTVQKEVPNFFPDPYADMMRIEIDQNGNVYKAYPVKFLGSDNFKEISEIIRKLGGSYVHGDKSQGVKAHFTIPKEGGEK